MCAESCGFYGPPRNHIYTYRSRSLLRFCESHCSLRFSGAVSTSLTEASSWPLAISFYKHFLEYLLYTEKGVTWKGKQLPILGNVMKELECWQLTAFNRLWISKHRMKGKRVNICFAVDVFASWGIHGYHSCLYCKRGCWGCSRTKSWPASTTVQVSVLDILFIYAFI